MHGKTTINFQTLKPVHCCKFDASSVCYKHVLFYICTVAKILNNNALLTPLTFPITSMNVPSTTRWPRRTASTFGGWNISTSLFIATCARACCWVWGSRDCAAPVSPWTHQKRVTLQRHLSLKLVVSNLRISGSFLDCSAWQGDILWCKNHMTAVFCVPLCRLQIHSPWTVR